jgi:hypothetical protein
VVALPPPVEPVWQIMFTLPQIEAKTVERQTEADYRSRPFRLGLELGGNAPFIVFDYGDVEATVAAAVDASLAIPMGMFAAGSPVNAEASGMINTFIAPVELSWKLAAAGFM